MAFTLPDLPYAKDAFGKLISAETFDYHHGKHHLAYVNKANELVAADASLQGKSLVDLIKSSKGGLFNQVGQIWNHSFYWQCLSPTKQEPTGKLKELIDAQFGSTDKLVDALNKALVAALDSTPVKARFQTLGLEAIPDSALSPLTPDVAEGDDDYSRRLKSLSGTEG